jgi:nucleotide-binding universal stress UspA family protein
MSNKVFHAIAATDFSPLGDRAVLHALRLASREGKAELHVIAVGTAEGDSIRLPVSAGIEKPMSEAEAQEAMRGRIADLVGPEASEVQETVERISVYLTTGAPAPRVVQLAESLDADLIVLGTHGRTGLKRMLLGSVAEEVLKSAPCTVVVLRPRDFLAGERLPDVQKPLAAGEHALTPFHHAPTHHYVDRGATASSRMLQTW